ncbi:hypothetical protein MUY27_15120 [Mucilaginibacter sp. RS28]|uniref:Uncharacterized protein n=1 Tax=Mucilaginibacter straminoryzae TaxID=2932774 RepID=A0A9X1X7D5_9SPHI|nr:hypothetical protein [Mucilaginibacter straminoryzae]MCJ8211048.1 hypothetical protein [Mucilaginibacter straminoryzae]
MKRILVLILTVCYLGLSSGATLHFQYCMGRLVGVGLSPVKAKVYRCGMAKRMAAKKCCKDKYQEFKTDKSSIAVSTAVPDQMVATPPNLFFVWSPVVTTLTRYLVPQAQAPPLALAVPIYKRNATFRI